MADMYIRFKKAPIQKALVNKKIAPNSKLGLRIIQKLALKNLKMARWQPS